MVLLSARLFASVHISRYQVIKSAYYYHVSCRPTIGFSDCRHFGTQQVSGTQTEKKTMSDPLVLVTGASGFLGTHVVKTLQEAGYRVRGTVRSTRDVNKIQHLYDLCPNAKYKLELVEADLTKSDSWNEAVKGCTYVHHVASPFPLSAPKDEMEVIGPAVEGTVSVLRACVKVGGVKRVVLTSSAAAVTHKGGNAVPLTEKEWTDTNLAPTYPKSKTLAEKAAWDFIKELPDDQKLELATINPVLIVGPTLHGSSGASTDIVKQIVCQLPVIPKLNFGVIDVRDVAQAHLRCMTIPDAVGNRHILFNRTCWMIEIAQALAKEFNPQGYRISTWQLPLWILWVVSFFNSEAAFAYDSASAPATFDNSRLRDVLKIKPIPMEKSFIDMTYSMIEKGFINKAPGYKNPGS